MNWKFTKYRFDDNDCYAINKARDSYAEALKKQPDIRLSWIDGFDAGFWRGLSWGIFKRIHHGPCKHTSILMGRALDDADTIRCKSCHSILNKEEVYQNRIKE